MRVLLDESLPRGLTLLLSDHQVTTVGAQGWAGLKNGELLDRASERFDTFITIDSNLQYQQTLERYPIGIVILKARSNRLADLEPLVPEILASLEDLEPGSPRKIGA